MTDREKYDGVRPSSGPAGAAAPPGSLLDRRYRLESLIGQGGMGSVYRALDTRLGRPVAVKLLSDSPAADEDRFRSEVRTLARLSHPNLVRVLDAGQSAGHLFLVMELIEGTTLAERLRQGALPPDAAARLGSAMAAALAYVHRAGVVHRDIKPANILLDRDGGAHLADFGIARLVDATGMTSTGLALGTPAYLAPEQVQGGRIGPPADVYALGLVLLECLTGARAFTGTASEMTAARLHHAPELPEWLWQGWQQVLGAMTMVLPDDRPTAAAVHKRLAELSRDEATAPLLMPTAAPALAPPLPRGDTQVLPRSSPRIPPAPAPRRRKILLAVLGGVIALLVLLAATGVFSDSPLAVRGAGQHSTSTLPNVGLKSTQSSTTIVPTTTVPTTTTSPGVGAAAGAVVAAIENGVRHSLVDPSTGQQLVNQLNQVLFPPEPLQPFQVSQQLGSFASMLGQAISQGQVTGTAPTAITAAVDRLAVALGVSPPTVTTVTGQTGPPGHKHKHGDGGGG